MRANPVLCRKILMKDQFTSTKAPWITAVFFALAFYGLGAGMMDGFAMYHTWRFIGANEFATAHMEAGRRIIAVLVVPFLVMTVFLVLLFWHRHKAISRLQLWICLFCSTIGWLSSAFIQIPLQGQLSQGKNDELLDWLIVSDWIRTIPLWIMMAIILKMIHQCLISSRAA